MVKLKNVRLLNGSELLVFVEIFEIWRLESLGELVNLDMTTMVDGVSGIDGGVQGLRGLDQLRQDAPGLPFCRKFSGAEVKVNRL